MLMKRQLPSVVLRLLCNMYLNHVTLFENNGFKSAAFKGLNGVKQGGIISPIMFCVYIDDLLLSLKSSGVGCYMGNFFVGALAYADDIVLLAPSANAMKRMLYVVTVTLQIIILYLMLANLSVYISIQRATIERYSEAYQYSLFAVNLLKW